jgi:long-chain acyl-CoA synthetase
VVGEYRNIAEAFQARVREHPDKTALVYLGTRYSYARLWNWVCSFARSLDSLGVEPGDRVMIYLHNCPQWLVAYLGLLLKGAAVVPLSPIYPARDLSFVARDSGAKAIVCANSNFGYVSQILPETGLKTVIHTKITDFLPVWKKALALAFDKIPRGRVSRGPEAVSFTGLLAGNSQEFRAEAGPRDLAAILYTGGTTSRPKGAPYTHELLLEPLVGQLAVAEKVIPRGENVILLAAPLFHITGLTFGPGAMYLSGETVIVLPRLNPDGLMDAVQREKAGSLYAVPSLYRLLLEHDRLDWYDFGSLRYCFSGGDVFPGQVGERWRKRFGLAIGQAYGATETGGGVSLSDAVEAPPAQSVGRPLAAKRIRIVDPRTLRDLPAGEPGELLVGSDPMVKSYWNRPAETAAAFINLDDRLWYRTGDIMRQDRDGYLYFVDRVTDSIVHRGRRISVSEIETAIQEHPAVTGACVVGVPDVEAGERIKAFVVLKDNQRGLSGQHLIDWLEKRLPEEMVPQYVEFRDTLPKSKVGKLLRRELRSEARERLKKGVWDEAVED